MLIFKVKTEEFVNVILYVGWEKVAVKDPPTKETIFVSKVASVKFPWGS